MIVRTALKRTADSLGSRAGSSSSIQKTDQISAAEASRKVTREGHTHALPYSSTGQAADANVQQAEFSAPTQNIAAANGANLLAPTTIKFVVDTIGGAFGRHKTPNHSNATALVDQYRLQAERQKLSRRTAAPELIPGIFPEPETIEAEPEVSPAKKPARSIQLPRRLYVPGPVKSGRVFHDQDIKDENHKTFKSGWISVKTKRR